MFGNLLNIGNFLVDGLKWLTFILDQAIYALVSVVYKVFYYLASASILDNEIVTNVTARIYTLLGILMVFVLAWNLLNYIVDPDKITDKKIGATAFVKDVIIALVIISMAPMAFTKLYAFQSQVITSGVIENLILGGATVSNTDGSELEYDSTKYSSQADYYVERGADNMIASVYVAFLYPIEDFTALDCGTEKEDEGYKTYCSAYGKVKDGVSISAFESFITNDQYNFTPFLTTAAGIVLLFFMLSFCINLAKRVGKMAIIQLVAPIPCTLELLPNKKGSRDNWLKTLFKVYCEVFVYIGTMYIVIFFITLVPGVIYNVFANVGTGANGFVKLITIVILIYGLLVFGKDAPKFLTDLLGIKSDGMLKEVASRGLKMAGAATVGMGVGATAMARGAWNTGKKINEIRKDDTLTRRQKFGRITGSAVGGVLGTGLSTATGAVRGTYMNRSGGFRNIRATTSNAVRSQEASQRRTSAAFQEYRDNITNASTGGERVREVLRPAGTPFAAAGRGVAGWVTGSNVSYEAQNAQLKSFTRYSDVFKGTKVTTSQDERYMSYQKDLDKLLTDNGMHDFYEKSSAWMKANGTNDINAYLASSDFATDYGAAGTSAADDIRNLSQAMSSRESSMILGKKSDITIALAQAKALVEQNGDIAEIARDKGIDISALDTSKFTSDTEWIDAYNKLKDLNKAVSNKSTEIRADIAAREMRESAREKKDKK